MMRYSFTAITGILLALCAYAQDVPEQDWDDLPFLAESKHISLDFDFTDADILGVPFEEYLKAKPNWTADLIDMRSKFIEAFNDGADHGRYPHCIVSSREPHNYKMVIKVKTVDQRGTNILATLFIYDNEGHELFRRHVQGHRGQVGTLENLMGDAFEEMGEDIGGEFRRNAKPSKKKK